MYTNTIPSNSGPITVGVVAVQIGTASESLNEWADEEAGLEAVQKVVESLDDIYALQDPFVDNETLRDILHDDRLHLLLQVRYLYLLLHIRPREFREHSEYDYD